MSALPEQIQSTPHWKEEINRRLAAHKNRKGGAETEPEVVQQQGANNGRAAQLAARVAARYAQAPTYSEMLAEEARAAVRAAEAAAHAALEAHAAAESVLAGIEAAANIESGPWKPEFSPEVELPAGPVLVADADAAAVVASSVVAEPLAPAKWHEIPAATILEFPRELIATRKMRPGFSESPDAERHEKQLSIFDVDSGSLDTEPEMGNLTITEAPAMQGSVWADIALDERPAADYSPMEPESESALSAFELAPISQRLMAIVVDNALSLAATFALGAMWASHATHLPAMKQTEMIAVAAFAVISMIYQALFITFSGVTLGMRYARIALSTFDDLIPSRQQRQKRVLTMMLSMLPMGLGFIWSLFDEEHLTWHDRVSHTYLRSL